jgi:hypothetical protein
VEDIEGRRTQEEAPRSPDVLAPRLVCPILGETISAGSSDPVTSLILKHNSDWVSQSGLFGFVCKREVRKRKQGGGLHSKD